VVAGVEPALLQADVIGCRIRRQCQEVHHQTSFAGTGALGDQTLGVVRIFKEVEDYLRIERGLAPRSIVRRSFVGSSMRYAPPAMMIWARSARIA
jgi:hypothetical protein